MQPTAVLNVVGLTDPLIKAHMPRLKSWAHRNRRIQPIEPVLPAVTCSAQASMLTGKPPAAHGIVANGWYDRTNCEVRFWQRSAQLFDAPCIWHEAKQRDAAFTCANVGWWHNAYSACDIELQVRPIYKADGRKLPDCYTKPAELRDQLQAGLGTFPLFRFWGPMADITSTQWLADAIAHIATRHTPTLLLGYLPHLDYDLQRLGPAHREIAHACSDLDAVVAELVETLEAQGYRVLIVSEYAIESASQPIAINRALRDAGLLDVRIEDGLDTLDPGACKAFAVADHQVAHVYVNAPGALEQARQVCGELAGVAKVLDSTSKPDAGMDHERAGDLVLVADHGAWFVYDFWLDEAKAPDYARTVDIHRKPGYDPRELFTNHSKPAVAAKLLKRKLGFRQLLDVIPLDNTLVKGTHGRVPEQADDWPVLIGPSDIAGQATQINDVHQAMLHSLFDESNLNPTVVFTPCSRRRARR